METITIEINDRLKNGVLLPNPPHLTINRLSEMVRADTMEVVPLGDKSRVTFTFLASHDATDAVRRLGNHFESEAKQPGGQLVARIVQA